MNNVLYDSLHKYYDKNENMNKFYSNIQGDNKISLRIIDWFVTNYSKKNFKLQINRTMQANYTAMV